MKTIKRKTSSLAIIMIFGITIISCLPATKPTPPEKSKYRAYNIDEIDLTLCNEGLDTLIDIENSRKDPTKMGVCIAGFPNMDAGKPDIVSTYFSTSTNVIVIVTIDGSFIPDDSIRSRETRIDFSKKNGVWEIDWMGSRWKCKSGRGHQNWSSSLCW